MKLCFSCNHKLEIDSKPGRADTCPACGADIKVCLNCAFYDETAYNSCKEPMAERVLEKERANYCDYFQLNDTESGKDRKKTDIKKLEELFK